ncbi:hypothetical protein FRC07_010602 [Ceratobasidium sp. 392]|nr:hypothetical protein FRC07_010602 [Ceratobasidium sp. 392]
MALIARATEPPMWDNEIVPTLRKRLESESRVLSKRMSIQAVAPEEQRPSPQGRSTSDDLPSNIPRPSLQLSEQTHAAEPARDSTPRPNRPRTHSTPRPFERDMPTPASSRSTSPAVQPSPRPSRIPTRPPRTGPRPLNDTAFPPSPEPSPDLWPVAEVLTQLTPPTPDVPTHPRKKKRETFVPPPSFETDEILIDEPAPFPLNAGNNIGPRTSLDEYEHWYRGEGRGGGGRNGGRGEIRVATRTEMLEIASFGHRPSPPQTSGSRDGHSYGFSSELGWRTKANDDSTVGTRSMWNGETTENVLDETPLTDLDDVDTDSMFPSRSPDARSIESHAQTYDHRTTDSYSRTVEHDPEPEPEDEPEPDPEPDGPVLPVTPAKQQQQQQRQQQPSRIARATSPSLGLGASTTSLVSRPGRSPTPSKARSLPQSKPQSPKAGNASKSPARRGTAASTASKSPSRAAGTSQLTPKSPRVGAVSPSRNNTPSPRTRVQSAPKRTKKLSTGGSSAPHPLADAIPHIPPSQTAPDDGNWDDVVLPTVARRMQGPDVVMLEGKPKEKKEEERVPPAPGTFGYLERLEELERAKERDRRRGSGLEMDEFGEWHGMRRRGEEKMEERKKAPSPPPFAAYTPHPPEPQVVPPPVEPRQESTRPSPSPTAQTNGMVITEADLRQNGIGKQKADDDAHGAGCCKCVVM